MSSVLCIVFLRDENRVVICVYIKKTDTKGRINSPTPLPLATIHTMRTTITDSGIHDVIEYDAILVKYAFETSIVLV
jgi:hypothetical protein